MKLATKLWISTALLLVLIFGIVGLSMWRFTSMEAQRDASLKMLSGKVTAAYAWSKLADIAALRTQAMIISADPALSDVFSKRPFQKDCSVRLKMFQQTREQPSLRNAS